MLSLYKLQPLQKYILMERSVKNENNQCVKKESRKRNSSEIKSKQNINLKTKIYIFLHNC